MNRRIIIYGNPDRTEDGFIHPGDLAEYIGGKVFSDEKGRYRYTQWKDADVIVLSRDGRAFGHFEVLDKVKPESFDIARFAKVRAVYLVGKSVFTTSPSTWRHSELSSFTVESTSQRPSFPTFKRRLTD